MLSAAISRAGASIGRIGLVVVEVAVLVGVDEREVERPVERGERLEGWAEPIVDRSATPASAA